MRDPIPGPRGLPDLRALLHEHWAPGRPFAVGMEIHKGRHIAEMERRREAGIWERETLARAELWWVGEEMTDLLDAEAPAMPPLVLSWDLMPAAEGLVRFAHPLTGIDSERLAALEVHAMQWGPIVLPPRRGSPQRTPGLGIASYRRHIDEGMVIWVPLGRADWVFGDGPDELSFDQRYADDGRGVIGPPMDLQAHASMVEDRRRLLALWILSAQEGLAERRLEQPDRATRRRAERAGLASPSVTVVHLRRPRQLAEGEATHRGWSRRWIVRGHKRQQAYGPGRSLRREIWIPPHVKGDPSKPLIISEKVKSWTR